VFNPKVRVNCIVAQEQAERSEMIKQDSKGERLCATTPLLDMLNETKKRTLTRND
jgi:hypothetical protein